MRGDELSGEHFVEALCTEEATSDVPGYSWTRINVDGTLLVPMSKSQPKRPASPAVASASIPEDARVEYDPVMERAFAAVEKGSDSPPVNDPDPVFLRIVAKPDQTETPPQFASLARASTSAGVVSVEFLHVDWGEYFRACDKEKEQKHLEEKTFPAPLLGRFVVSNRMAGELAVALLDCLLDSSASAADDLREVLADFGKTLSRHGIIPPAAGNGEA